MKFVAGMGPAYGPIDVSCAGNKVARHLHIRIATAEHDTTGHAVPQDHIRGRNGERARERQSTHNNFLLRRPSQVNPARLAGAQTTPPCDKLSTTPSRRSRFRSETVYSSVIVRGVRTVEVFGDSPPIRRARSWPRFDIGSSSNSIPYSSSVALNPQTTTPTLSSRRWRVLWGTVLMLCAFTLRQAQGERVSA